MNKLGLRHCHFMSIYVVQKIAYIQELKTKFAVRNLALQCQEKVEHGCTTITIPFRVAPKLLELYGLVAFLL